MSQIIKAFMGVFLTLFMAVTAMGILAAYMEVMNAQDMQARIVDEIENSDFNTGVVRQCFLQSEEAGYQLKVTFFNENSTVATVSQVSQIPYGMDGVDMAKVEMQFPFQVAFLGINRQHTFVSYARCIRFMGSLFISGKRIRRCGTGCGGRSCFSGHAGTVFAVQTGIDYADDRGLGKRRLLMKELIRQYAGTAIAVVTALVLIALVSEISVVVEKGIPKSRALCETDTGAFEGYWRSR